ncbi:hypothetical protein [Brochothrix campestris]|uniref:hypothetical protein n=1 Tax=Brochothrix campestris TaxID=2757 RepID=UPI0004BC8374|nr:hypothetical protein [Brochothrix campestris]
MVSIIATDIKLDTILQNEEFKDLFQAQETKIEKTEIDSFMSECRREIGKSILQTFGLGMTYDQFKQGGNLTTLHNANNCVFANEEIKQQYTTKFDRKAYEKDFPKMRKELFKNNKIIKDDYTRKHLKKDSRTHIDHVVSAKSIHDNDKARLYMTADQRNDMATHHKNLAVTNGSVNQSKGAKSLEDWMHSSNKKTGYDNATTYGVDVKKNHRNR